MKKLMFIIKRMTQVELAERLSIGKANITAWKVAQRVPRKQMLRLDEIYQELKNESKTKR